MPRPVGGEPVGETIAAFAVKVDEEIRLAVDRREGVDIFCGSAFEPAQRLRWDAPSIASSLSAMSERLPGRQVV
jgi:hypothetical protein